MRPELDDAEVQALGAGGFVMRDGLLGRERALAIAEQAAALPGFRAAGVAREGHREKDIRGDELVWLDPASAPAALASLYEVLGTIGHDLDAAAYLGLGRFDMQVGRYPGGGARYLRHRDAFAGGESRRLTVIYYANPTWRPEDGGLLRLYTARGPVDVEPRLDRLIAFLSTELEHEVLPVHAPRLAISAWFYGRHPLPLPARRA